MCPRRILEIYLWYGDINDSYKVNFKTNVVIKRMQSRLDKSRLITFINNLWNVHVCICTVYNRLPRVASISRSMIDSLSLFILASEIATVVFDCKKAFSLEPFDCRSAKPLAALANHQVVFGTTAARLVKNRSEATNASYLLKYS